MDQLVSGLPGEKAEPQQQSGELAKTSASNANQQNVAESETQPPAANSPQGIQYILTNPLINNEIMHMMLKVYYYYKRFLFGYISYNCIMFCPDGLAEW
jgi:hypothetical protein